MTKRENEAEVAGLLIFVVCGILLILAAVASCVEGESLAPSAAAQDAPRPALDLRGQDLTPAVVLARVCAKEAGFTGYADCPAIAVVLLRVGRGNVVRGAQAYSRKVFDPSRLGRRPWLAYLHGDGAEPRDWPSNISWRFHGPHWRAMVELAQNVLDGPGEAPCAPDHWGDRLHDAERARARGWLEVDCGPTVNMFWHVPRRERTTRAPTGSVSAASARGGFRR